MLEFLIIVLILLMLRPKKSHRMKSKKSRPWYDIRYNDMIWYDIFDDD